MRHLNKKRARQLMEKILSLMSAKEAAIGDGQTMWQADDFVIGSRVDVIGAGIACGCHDCGETVYTSRRYPAGISVVCEPCAADRLLGKEVTSF